MYRRSQRWMLIINNRFLSLYDYNFLLVIEKIRKRNSKICGSQILLLASRVILHVRDHIMVELGLSLNVLSFKPSDRYFNEGECWPGPAAVSSQWSVIPCVWQILGLKNFYYENISKGSRIHNHSEYHYVLRLQLINSDNDSPVHGQPSFVLS